MQHSAVVVLLLARLVWMLQIDTAPSLAQILKPVHRRLRV